MEPQIADRKRVRDEGKSSNIEMENPGERRSSQTRRGGRYQRSYRTRSERSSHSPRLLDFAPDLMTRFGSPPTSDNAESQVPVRGSRYASEESPLRSPLHKTRRGMQETPPLHGRRAPHNVGNHSTRQRATRLRRSSDATVPPQGEHERTVYISVRKCLWADEVDEAFCEGDLSDEPVVARDPPKTPTKDQLIRRQKDIDYGKATVGYKNYLERVPKDQRGNMCPQTPDKNSKVARRVWDSNVRTWRRVLHDWDAPSKLTPASTPSASPSKIRFRLADKTSGRGECMSPLSSTTSSPSDKGYITTPDSKCDPFSQDWDEDLWLEAMEQFPPLPSASLGEKKPWWQRVEEEEEVKEKVDSAELMEEEHLDQFVEKLKIGLPDKAE